MKILGFTIGKKQKSEPEECEPHCLTCVGDNLDYAIDNYSELLDNNCRDTLILDAARERIADLQEKYQQLKLERLR